MPVDFAAWLAHSAKTRVFLVETAALRPGDMESIPLYLADRGLVINACAYLGCALDLPRLTRQSNDNLNPNRVPTWGELTLARDDLVNPDAANTLSWAELLSPDYVFTDRPLVIKLGGLAADGFTYGDFEPVFTGFIEKAGWKDDQVTLTLYDKGRDFEEKIADFALPECPYVVEGSWGQTVPLVLGSVLNYKPILISETEAGAYPWRYALAAHVINRLNAVYLNNQAQNWGWTPGPVRGIGIPSLPGTASMELRLKDVLPPHRDAVGTATMQAFGPYTGALYRAEWRVEIATITRLNDMGQSGPEVGLAAFDWYLNGVKQNSVPVLTWKLAPGAVTKDPALGGSVMTLAGEFTGETKRAERTKITAGGNYSTPAKFKLSEDGGATWGSEISITSGDPIDLGNGLTAAFTAATRIGTPTKTGTGSGDLAAITGTYTGSVVRNYQCKITQAGDEVTAKWKWTDDGGVTWSGVITGLPYFGPMLLSYGVSVQFTMGSYDLDDLWSWSAYPPFVADDLWAFSFIEIPIPLADGVSIQYFTQAGTDFAVGDEMVFILGSTLCLASVGEGVNLTVDAEGLVSPADDLYTDKAGGIIQALLLAWRGWTTADVNQTALTAFNTAIPYKMGLLVDSPTAISQIIEDLLKGIPCLYTIDRAGKLFLAELTAPSGTPVLDLGDGKKAVLDSPEGSDGGDGVYRRVYLNYGRNHNVESSPAGAPTQERVEWLRREWRQACKKDNTVQTVYPRARDLGPLDTALQTQADAEALAAKDLNFYQVARQTQEVISPDMGAFILDLNAVAQLRGDLYRLRNLDLDFTRRQGSLEIWR